MTGMQVVYISPRVKAGVCVMVAECSSRWCLMCKTMIIKMNMNIKTDTNQ